MWTTSPSSIRSSHLIKTKPNRIAYHLACISVLSNRLMAVNSTLCRVVKWCLEVAEHCKDAIGIADLSAQDTRRKADTMTVSDQYIGSLALPASSSVYILLFREFSVFRTWARWRFELIERNEHSRKYPSLCEPTGSPSLQQS
jgi:hypothetical protein